KLHGRCSASTAEARVRKGGWIPHATSPGLVRDRPGDADLRARLPPEPSRRPRGQGVQVSDRWASLPNRITLLRLGALPVLWVLAGLRETTALAIGLIVAASTD